MRSLSDTTCRTCGQPMPPDSLEGLYSRKSELEQQLTERRQGPTVDALALRERRLRRFNAAAATVTQLQEFESDLKRTRLRMVDDQGKIDRLTDLIQDNSLDIAALDSQASDAQQALGSDCHREEGSECKATGSGVRKEERD